MYTYLQVARQWIKKKERKNRKEEKRKKIENRIEGGYKNVKTIDVRRRPPRRRHNNFE